ncbi:hypothetical protein QP324_09200 [Corynebacterium sp. UMB0012]|uniref:hypothetical protein n=1 Tax=Corynebacterium sp. UMB0012 TaxID=3046344 RepID=UPI00254B37CC|nr:hypothetical protein [Corynebacterium sp. UMB0012]MDK7048751.1 hypothetical protein [Corynebacterium sp. UMB0012]
MSVEDIKQQIAALTPPEYQEVWSFVVNEEYERRNADRYTAKLVGEMQDKGEIAKPEAVTEDDVKSGADVPEWKDPGTDHAKMHTYGQVVRYDGKLVRSTHDGLNCWAPGTLGFDGRIWEVVDEPETTETSETSGESESSETSGGAQPDDVKDFVQPTGAHNVYAKGAKVRFQGKVYESTIPNNAYSPAAYPQGWKEIG